MFPLTDLRTVHVELTSRCQASCPMCLREVLGTGVRGFSEVSITRAEFVRWVGPVVGQLEYLLICGNLGEPILAPDALGIVEWARAENPRMGIALHTNGSARPAAFWRRLAEQRVRAAFALDGLADTHARYRVGTHWNSVIENARTFIAAGGEAEWHMLVFAHNEHQVDVCRQMSEAMGFASFVARHTTRFVKRLDSSAEGGPVSPDNGLAPSSGSRDLLPGALLAMTGTARGIDCKSLRPPQVFIAATGEVHPCCWLDACARDPGSRFGFDRSTKTSQTPSLHSQTLREIVGSSYFADVAGSWATDPLPICAIQCGQHYGEPVVTGTGGVGQPVVPAPRLNAGPRSP